MRGSGGRMQLCRFPRNRVCLIELALKPKSTSEVVLRRKCKRIQFSGLPGLFLRLIRFTQINDDSRKQVVRRRLRTTVLAQPMSVPTLASERDRDVLRSFARRIDPSDAGAHNNLGVLYYHKGLYEEAVAAFMRALGLDSLVNAG